MAGSAVLDAVLALAPTLLKRADEIEEGGHIPADVLADLVAAGCFRMQVPRAYGGEELPLADVVDVLAELARIDASIGWTVMIGSQAPVFLSLLPEDRFEAAYANGPDVILAGAIAPKGRAVPTEGGYLVSGRWPFASGAAHAHILAVNCVVVDGDAPPEMRMVLVPREHVEFLDTWHVMGMRGTASGDIEVRDVFVPDADAFRIFGVTPSVDGPLFRVPLRPVVGSQVAAVSVGVAQGALDDLAAIAPGKRPAMNPRVRLAEDVVFQHQFGAAALRLHAARVALVDALRGAWDAAVENRQMAPEERVRIRALGAYVTAECATVVDAAYTLAGSVPVYSTSPLQRRLRDIHVITQHQASTPESYRVLGALLAGEEQDLSLF